MLIEFIVIVASIGWFNAYGFAARNTTADVFVHLGDYVSNLTEHAWYSLRP